jgi:hypothetical protein
MAWAKAEVATGGRGCNLTTVPCGATRGALNAIFKRFSCFRVWACSVLLPSYSRQKGALYVDEEFKFHLWHGGVTELVSVPIVSGAADQWPENPEDGKRSMMMHPVRKDVSFDARILTLTNVS